MFKRDKVYYGCFFVVFIIFLRFAVCGLGFAGCGLRFVVFGFWFAVCGLWCTVCLVSANSLAGNSFAAVFGQCCCYCKSGSPVSVYTAPGPVGPWTKQNQIGSPSICAPDAPTGRASAMLSDVTWPSHAKCNSSIPLSVSVGAQQSDIFAWTDAEGVLQFMFVKYNIL
jgi:hypothetical protein